MKIKIYYFGLGSVFNKYTFIVCCMLCRDKTVADMKTILELKRVAYWKMIVEGTVV